MEPCRRHVVAVVLAGAEEFAAGGYRIAAALEDHALSAHIVDHAVLDPCVFDVFVKPAVEHEAAVALCDGAAAYQNVFQLVLLGIVKEAVCSASYRADEYCRTGGGTGAHVRAVVLFDIIYVVEGAVSDRYVGYVAVLRVDPDAGSCRSFNRKVLDDDIRHVDKSQGAGGSRHLHQRSIALAVCTDGYRLFRSAGGLQAESVFARRSASEQDGVSRLKSLLKQLHRAFQRLFGGKAVV